MKPYFQEGSCTIFRGDARDVLPELTGIDHIITDPPYSRRTHEGHRAGTDGNDGSTRLVLDYEFLSAGECSLYAELFAAACSGWIVWMTDHTLAPTISDALELHDRYVFAPLPFFAPGSRVRLAGDGPSSWTDWIIVSRTAKLSRWGTLPGGYVAGRGKEWNDKQWMGGKPSALMGMLVRDYSRQGELVCDPFMGAGTTLLAARDQGRRAIGIDIAEEACEVAATRLSQSVMAL